VHYVEPNRGRPTYVFRSADEVRNTVTLGHPGGTDLVLPLDGVESAWFGGGQWHVALVARWMQMANE
jgi:hypothetical protein